MFALRVLSPLLIASVVCNGTQGSDLLVEAESFRDHGGWALDTQFISTMGSPYLLAHGLGRPVKDAVTRVEAPQPGKYRVFVRTLDWVARWKAAGTPGRFQLLVNGKPLPTTFGTTGAHWSWQDGGVVELRDKRVDLSLRDLTGFDGRCDAILLTSDLSSQPTNDSNVLPKWRRTLLGLADEPTEMSGYDLVVVGGGYSGMGAAISAARMGCKVALIQNRGVLGGNGSSEVRVWAQGLIRRGKYPRLGEIVEEFADRAAKSPGLAQEFGDPLKEGIVRKEQNIDLFLHHHAYHVETKDGQITAVLAFDTRTSEQKKFVGRLYADCTGHGTIGFLAGGDWDMKSTGRMGMSNMWRWDEVDQPVEFPPTPWALQLKMKDFPYPRDHHGQWFWESGFDVDPIGDAEAIRDWNLRSVYGAFAAMKNGDGRAKHRNAQLTWLAYIGGPRESRRLIGDVILSREDIVSKRQFPDGCVPSTWSIDLHYPKKQYAKTYPDNPFISVAEHDLRIDRSFGYPVPYRCFYSRNLSNLFMAGRCISVTHEALGTTRVMKTCGMMGEVVGKAASICSKHDCSPRDVYANHWNELSELLQLPGQARRATVNASIVMPEKIPPASRFGPITGQNPDNMPGMVIDDVEAARIGSWTAGSGLKGYVGFGYLYAPADSGATLRFDFQAPEAGRYELRLAYLAHENRGSKVPVTMVVAGETKRTEIDMRAAPPLPGGFVSLGAFDFQAGQGGSVTLSTERAGGYVHGDALQLLPVK